ncbi:MAG: hypothetical protein K2M91_05475, partial [Lachnospiraceae bacterium]|nr:hypothetical protein [Lachnospiraceae bacterium]
IIETMKDDTDNKVWFQSVQMEQDNIYNNILIVTLYIIGFVFILESQSLVMIRQILDDTNERYQYEILNQLGIEKRELRSIQNGKIKNTIIFPEVSAIITGIIFFMADYFYQIQGNIEWDVLFQYIKILVSFGLIQYIGYRVVICVINRYYTGRF